MPTHTQTIPTPYDYQGLGAKLAPLLKAEAVVKRSNQHAAEPVGAAAEPVNGIYLTFPDGRSFYVHSPYGNKGRLVVSCNWPKNRDGRELYPRDSEQADETTSITVSQTRTPEQIANEIKRRLLPSYVRLYALMQERIKAENSYEDTVQGNLEALLAQAQVPSNVELGRTRPGERQTSFSLYHSRLPLLKDIHGELRVESTGVEIKVSVSVSRAKAVLQLLAQPIAPVEGPGAEEIPSKPGWYWWRGQNEHGDEQIPVRVYWLARDLMAALPNRVRKVSATAGWKGPVTK